METVQSVNSRLERKEAAEQMTTAVAVQVGILVDVIVTSASTRHSSHSSTHVPHHHPHERCLLIGSNQFMRCVTGKLRETV